MPKIHTKHDSRDYIGVASFYSVVSVYVGDNSNHKEVWLNAEEAKELISDLQRAVNEIENEEEI